ncbi:hypothetical protein BDW02DRAFT_603084 [Decorospora gaudefroyi]|uniref:Uncharacterized protein n=1 Tax=Decorospora gaudefroyi TaxID=184978 RepID=A0A6A5JXN0_9PLEO|nr:hypothetical protein BDW02DRAFT_603084 [Decorospora gaudefroyi]
MPSPSLLPTLSYLRSSLEPFQPQLDSVFNAKQWEQFVNMAQSKIRMIETLHSSLTIKIV